MNMIMNKRGLLTMKILAVRGPERQPNKLSTTLHAESPDWIFSGPPTLPGDTPRARIIPEYQ